MAKVNYSVSAAERVLGGAGVAASPVRPFMRTMDPAEAGRGGGRGGRLFFFWAPFQLCCTRIWGLHEPGAEMSVFWGVLWTEHPCLFSSAYRVWNGTKMLTCVDKLMNVSSLFLKSFQKKVISKFFFFFFSFSPFFSLLCQSSCVCLVSRVTCCLSWGWLTLLCAERLKGSP